MGRWAKFIVVASLLALGAWYMLAPDDGANDGLHDGEEPVPQDYGALRAAYGDFSYTEGKGGRIVPDAQWVADNIVTVDLHGKHVKVHHAIADELARLYDTAVAASGWEPSVIQGFVPRHKGWDPDRDLSIHSWGVAVDFDPAQNGVNDANHTMPDAFAQVFLDAGWDWGGSWSSAKDWMHIQRARGKGL